MRRGVTLHLYRCFSLFRLDRLNRTGIDIFGVYYSSTSFYRLVVFIPFLHNYHDQNFYYTNNRKENIQVRYSEKKPAYIIHIYARNSCKNVKCQKNKQCTETFYFMNKYFQVLLL